jgi:hypothetical protein
MGLGPTQPHPIGSRQAGEETAQQSFDKKYQHIFLHITYIRKRQLLWRPIHKRLIPCEYMKYFEASFGHILLAVHMSKQIYPLQINLNTSVSFTLLFHAL